jgi:predicted phosphodiesterase
MTTAITNDIHHPDDDQRGFLDFLCYADERAWRVIVTELLDWDGLRQRDLRADPLVQLIVKMAREGRFIAVAGNHDWNCYGLGMLGYPWREGEPQPDSWTSEDGRIHVEHGHGACKVWRGMDRWSRATLRAYDRLLRYGYYKDGQADWALRMGKRIVGRGWEGDGTRRQVDYSRCVREREGAEISVMGHTHEPLVHKGAGGLHFNTGAWTPLDHAWTVPGIGDPIECMGCGHIFDAKESPKAMKLACPKCQVCDEHTWPAKHERLAHLEPGDIPSFFVLYDGESASFWRWQDGPRKVWG